MNPQARKISWACRVDKDNSKQQPHEGQFHTHRRFYPFPLKSSAFPWDSASLASRVYSFPSSMVYFFPSTGILLTKRSSTSSEALPNLLNVPSSIISTEPSLRHVAGRVEAMNFTMTRNLCALSSVNLESSRARAAARDSGEPRS